MLGLRQRQKAKRNENILQAASTLFGQVGYEAARIDAIAEAAEVSVGTFYNYFQTKADILMAIVGMEVEEVLHQGTVIVADPPQDTETALLALISTYYDHSLVYLTKEMWRAGFAMSIQHPDTPFSRRFRELDMALADQVGALIGTLQERRAIRTDIPSKAVGEMIFNDLNALFIAYVTDEAMPADDLRQSLASHISGLTRLLRG